MHLYAVVESMYLSSGMFIEGKKTKEGVPPPLKRVYHPFRAKKGAVKVRLRELAVLTPNHFKCYSDKSSTSLCMALAEAEHQ